MTLNQLKKKVGRAVEIRDALRDLNASDHLNARKEFFIGQVGESDASSRIAIDAATAKTMLTTHMADLTTEYDALILEIGVDGIG